MAKQNTGYARMKTLTVVQGAYTHSYDITSGFASPSGTTYAALTLEAFALLSEEDYSARRAAFIEYVCAQEPGLADDCPSLENGSVVFDPDTCPITLQTDLYHEDVS